MENHFVTKYMIDGEWQEAIDDNTSNICLYCSFYNSNSDLCSECCHANHAEEGEKMKPELERCPFCGGHAVYKYEPYSTDRQGVYVMCGNCAISTMVYPLKDPISEHPEKYSPMFPDKYEPFDGHEDAAKAWNRREGEQNDR